MHCCLNMAEIITSATARDRDLVTDDPPKCWRRPNHKPFTGRLNGQFTEDDRIYWICPTCGDDGTIDGWHGLTRDVSFYDEEGRVVH